MFHFSTLHYETKKIWNLTKIKKNVDGNYLLWNNISMGKNIGMLLEAELWFCRSAENEGENICLVREGMGKLAL